MCPSALKNTSEIQRLLDAAGAEVRKRGTVVLWVHTDEFGRGGKVEISRSSGVLALDAAAVRIARQMEFHPALNDRVPVALVSEIPVTF